MGILLPVKKVQMYKKTIIVTVGIAALVIFFHTTAHHCSVNWLDKEFKRVDGPFQKCPRHLESRALGNAHYALINGEVYWYNIEIQTSPGGNCMVGVTCLPIPSRPSEWRVYNFIRLGSDIQFERLQSSADGQYASDGVVLLHHWDRVVPYPFELKLSQMHPLWPGSSFVSDGSWLLYGPFILGNAITGKLQRVPIRSLDGHALENEDIVRDEQSVFYKSTHIYGADPATFAVIKYQDGELPPDIKTNSYLIASDTHHAWALAYDKATILQVNQKQLKRLRTDTQQATVAPKLN